jgi:hypothetical protein
VNLDNKCSLTGTYAMTTPAPQSTPPVPTDPKSIELDRNYAAFQRRLPDLLESHTGQYAVMRHGDIIEFFDTMGDAAKFCGREYADGVFSIQEVTARRVDLGYYSHAMHHPAV